MPTIFRLLTSPFLGSFTDHFDGLPTTRQSDCELQFSREFRLGILLVRCTTVRLVALYAHLELADSIVNLLCVGPSVTENQAASSRWVQVACGQWRCGNAPMAAFLDSATSLTPGGSIATRCIPASAPITSSTSPNWTRIAFTSAFRRSA